MKDLIKLLIKLSFLVLVVYSLILCFFSLKEYEVGLVKDISSGQIVTSFKSRYNFVWQAGLPWKYKAEKVEIKNAAIIDVIIQIPSLSSLTDDIYFIKIPLNISYQLKKDNLPDLSVIESRKNMDLYISGIISDIYRSYLIDDLEPVYDRNKLVQDQNKLNDKIFAEVNKKLASIGIIPERIEFLPAGYFPDKRLYEEGLVRNKEMRDLDFNNKKQEILLKKQLFKEKSEHELYFEKLLRISTIIKDNPEILKYIYIDKLGDDIKVIISSDKTGIPAMFGDTNEANKSGVKGDIDNLR